MPGTAQRFVEDRVFRGLDGPLASGARVVTESITLDDGTDVTLAVSPVEVFAKDAQILLHEDLMDVRIAPPTDRWFVGRVVGDPSSLVVLARGASVRGFVVLGDRVATIYGEHGAYEDRPRGRTLVRTFSPEREMPDAMRRFQCDTDTLPIPPQAFLLAASPRTALSSIMYYGGVAVETDHELYLKFNSASKLAKYVGDLFAAVSAVYQRDVLVTLQVNYLSIWATSSDPWTATSSSAGLSEFMSYWNTNRTAVPRLTAHMLAGRKFGGGIAYLSALCTSYGYGLVGSLSGVSPPNLTTTYWDFMAVTHELGHNFGSPHTHCYKPPVDECYANENNCYSGPTSVPPEKGTVMSYCHLLSGAYGNIKMFLGVPGEASQAVLTKIRTYVEGRTSCFGTVAVPVVTGIAPPSGSTTGGTHVTISGTGFAGGSAVKIGGTSATSVVVVNATSITAVTPAGAEGPADVTVISPGNQGFTLWDGYTYTSTPTPPTVTGINPSSGPTAGWTAVTITGTGFVTGATVALGGVAASSVSVVNSTTITATTGAHAAGAVNVVVTNPDATPGTLASGYTYLAPPWATSFYTVTPCRVIDTRNPNGPLGGPALSGNGAQRPFTVTGACGIPASARSISVNLTVTQEAASGSLTAYPGDGTPNGTSSISFTAGKTRANNAILYLATDGTGTIGVENDATGTVHFILDVNGYFR